MSSKVRSFFSASLGPGLTLFTACSAAFNGPLAVSTMLGFGCTILYGIVEVTLLSYTPVASIELTGPSLLIDEDGGNGTGSEPDSTLVNFRSAHDHVARAA